MSALAGAQKAAEAGDLQYLQSKAHMLERPLLEQISLYAARGGQLEVLQWLSLQGAALSPHMCTWAAGGGHLAVLQYARQNGCAWDSSTCEAAAGGGHLAVLQYARQNGCAWSSGTCEAAARGGHLAVLQYARQNGCAWSSWTCEAAARGGNPSILRWLHQHGCPWDCWTSISAAVHGHSEVFEWARQQQPPCPLWNCTRDHMIWFRRISPCTLVYLAQQEAPMLPRMLAQAHVSATEMTYAVLSLKAALPDRTPHEVVLSIVSLAFSDCQPFWDSKWI